MKKLLCTNTLLFYYQRKDGTVAKVQRKVEYFELASGGVDRVYNALFDLGKEAGLLGLQDCQVVARCLATMSMADKPAEGSVYIKSAGGAFRKMGKTKLPKWVEGSEYEAELSDAYYGRRSH